MDGLIPLFKTLHIVGFTAWFAGMFYLVRIFVYHTEAFEFEEPKRSILIDQYNLMAWRVFRIICNPGMIITWVFGLLMIFCYGIEWLKFQEWLHFKIALVIALTGYHHYNKKLIIRLENGEFVFSSTKFRLFNEVPSVFLVAIVLLAVYKNGLNYVYAIIGIVLFISLLIIFTKIYKQIREKH